MSQEKKLCRGCKLDIASDATKCAHCRTDQRNWFRRHPIITFLLIIFIVPIVISTIGTNSPTENVPSSKITLSPEERQSIETEVVELKKYFTEDTDEFKKITWYKAKDQQTIERNLLEVIVRNDGYYYLASQYKDDDWIFHTHANVKIGDVVYKTSVVPTYSEDNYTNATGYGVFERVSYTDASNQKIIEAIAQAPDVPILIRFEGGQLVEDFQLSKIDHESITRSYKLAMLLKKLELSK